MILLDSHAHLDSDLGWQEIDATLERARGVGVAAVITVGSGDGVAYARHALEVAERHDDVFATAAVHPHDARLVDEAVFEEVAGLFEHPRVVCVGETGLDYHYDLSPRDTQVEVFRRYIRLARDLGKPLSLHVREAHAEAQRILEEEGASEVGGVAHCFTSGADDARRYLDLGMHISIPGVVTFKKAEELQAALHHIPLERLLVETDSPYLAPVPKRGRKNEPAYVLYTVLRIAELLGLDPDELGRRTAENAVRLFGLPEALLAPA